MFQAEETVHAKEEKEWPTGKTEIYSDGLESRERENSTKKSRVRHAEQHLAHSRQSINVSCLPLSLELYPKCQAQADPEQGASLLSWSAPGP